jgi:hypothetical protein
MPDAPPVTIALPCVPHHLFPMQAETGRAWTGIPVEARRRAAASCGGRSAATPTRRHLHNTPVRSPRALRFCTGWVIAWPRHAGSDP